MKVKLFYRSKNNEYFGTKTAITIKEAKKLCKELLLENKDIIEIYIKKYSGWNWIRVKTLYQNVKDK